jgi:hypothetical protein
LAGGWRSLLFLFIPVRSLPFSTSFNVVGFLEKKNRHNHPSKRNDELITVTRRNKIALLLSCGTFSMNQDSQQLEITSCSRL